MDQEFLNLYIENMNKKIEDLSRKEIFNLTQIMVLENLIKGLQLELEATKQKPNKKTKEVNTSNENF